MPKNNKKNIGLWLLIAIVALSMTGLMNKAFMGALMTDPLTGNDVPYKYTSAGCPDASKVDGKCPLKFISCETNADCQNACVGSTSYKWIADQMNMTENEIYQDIQTSYCDGSKHCVVSEYCVSSGAVKEWVLGHPWAWVQQNPMIAVGIGVAIIVFLLI